MSTPNLEYEELIDERIQSLSKKPYRILVVDDEEVMVKMITAMLKNDTFVFSEAYDGLEATRLVESETVQLIISDIRMPNMLGTQFVEQLRESNDSTPVIFMTGYSEYDLISDAIRLQPFGFLEKPFDVQMLRALVTRAHKEYVQQSAREMQATILSELVEEKTRDISFRTERLMAEQQLLQGIVNQATFGLVAVDSESNVHLLNEFAASRAMQTGTLGLHCHGQPLAGLLVSELKAGFMQMFSFALEKADRQESTFHLADSDQTLQVVAYPIRFRDEVSAVVFVVHDITEQEILQRRLVQSAKLASIGELAAGVAHEINNPVGFVTSNINTLGSYWQKLEQYFGYLHSSAGHNGAKISDLLSQARKEFDLDYLREDIPALLSETTEGLARVTKIVSDLKTFARADNPQPEPGDIISIIEDSLNLCRNVTKYKLEIIRDYRPAPTILCFPTQLVQVFTNLIVNSAHATIDKGTLTVTVSADEKEVTVRFRDSGSGIAPDILPRIFDPFFTTKDPGKGTGMGLSISYGIILRHGGSITADSVLGKGTEFTVKLPIQASFDSQVSVNSEVECQ